jgi:hypothetical protein
MNSYILAGIGLMAANFLWQVVSGEFAMEVAMQRTYFQWVAVLACYFVTRVPA